MFQKNKSIIEWENVFCFLFYIAALGFEVRQFFAWREPVAEIERHPSKESRKAVTDRLGELKCGCTVDIR